jgi:long-chain acyl-CoA synthetase
MIIVGGVNIYPKETEAALRDHPAVKDVAVIGVPNEDLGEEIKAIVELENENYSHADLAQELISFCQMKISKNKCPVSIEFNAALPRNELGKLSKKELREYYKSSNK